MKSDFSDLKKWAKEKEDENWKFRSFLKFYDDLSDEEIDSLVFKIADEVLLNAVRGISDLITVNGLINLDFADVKTVMSEKGMAFMGTGTSRSENRAVEAARCAMSSPLLQDLTITGAKGLLINITGGPHLTLYEVNEASRLIQEQAHEDANIIFGAVINDAMDDEVRVTVIATGFKRAPLKEKQSVPFIRNTHAPHKERIELPPFMRSI